MFGLIVLLEGAELPPGAKIVTAIITPEEGAHGDPKIPLDIILEPRYSRFIPTKEALSLMQTKVAIKKAQQLTRDSAAHKILALKEGYHYKDMASRGSVRARWLFCPKHLDEFFSRSPDARVKPARRRKAS